MRSLLGAEEVVLSAELAELLRHRELEWSCIPPLSRMLMVPYLTLKETLRLDSAVTERGDEENPGDRDHLEKAYVGLRSAGFDEWVFKDTEDFAGLRWARERGVDLRSLKLEYKGCQERDKVLCELVCNEKEDVATYYATRSDAKDMADGSTLREASRLGYLTVVRCILERGTETVDESNDSGWTPLYWASLNGHVEVVKALLAAKAEVNKSSNGGTTPLHGASSKGHVEVVKALLAAEAEVNKSDIGGRTPLYMASYKGHVDVVKALLAAEAEVNKSNNNGWTSLRAAIANSHPEVAAVLREAGGHE